MKYKDIFGYFRLGLVTGIVQKSALVAWADSEIMRCPIPTPEIIELSLSGSRPFSEIIWLLSSFEGMPSSALALKLLLARAGLLLEQEPHRASELIGGLRLLNEEEFVPKATKARVSVLVRDLALFKQDEINLSELIQGVAGFLDDYKLYRAQLVQLS